MEIPGAILDAILTRPFTKRQQTLIILFGRLTYGLNTDWAHIKNKKEVAAAAGLHWVDTYKEIKTLIETNVLQQEKKYIRINPQISAWKFDKNLEAVAAFNRLTNQVLEKAKTKRVTVNEILGETPKKINNRSHHKARVWERQDIAAGEFSYL